MNYFDSLGVPPLIINHSSSEENELSYMLNQALSLKSNSVGVFPKDTAISTLEGKGTKADFLGFIDYCDKNISHYILGNTLAGDSGNGGSYALGKVHNSIKEQYKIFDARLFEETFTNFLNMVLSLNFQDKKINFKFEIESNEDLEKLSIVYKNLTDSGYHIPEEHISKKFNIPGVKKQTESNSREFNSRAKTKKIDKIEAELNKLKLIKVDKSIKRIVNDNILKADSYEEAYENILKNYKDIDIDSVEEILADQIANSNIQGFLDAN